MRRARRMIDAGRTSNLVSRPGIDPRLWFTLGVVTELGFDQAEGIFADVQFQPSGQNETCYVGSNYAGAGYGEHNPLEIDDTVLVAVPSGDTDWGPVIVARMWAAGQAPPVDAELASGDDPSQDRYLRVKPGQRYILRTSGGEVHIREEAAGNVVVESVGGQVILGLESAAVELAKAEATATQFGILVKAIQANSSLPAPVGSAFASLASALTTAGFPATPLVASASLQFASIKTTKTKGA